MFNERTLWRLTDSSAAPSSGDPGAGVAAVTGVAAGANIRAVATAGVAVLAAVEATLVAHLAEK